MNQGNTSNDSDPNMSSGNTPVFTFDPLTGDDLSIDAGIYPTSTIGNYVWLDENGDGIQTGENGIAGVTVLLYDSNTGLPLDTVITDAMGAYEFSGVPSGDYYVVFDGSTSNDIDDFVYSPSGAGTAATGSDVDASGQTASFSFDALVVGGNPDIDAGIIPQSDLGNFVWLDTDQDGIQDAGEVGVGNIEVRLLDDASNAILATTFTDVNGEYLFENVLLDAYRIDFVIGTNYQFTTAIAGNTALDSDANTTTGETTTINFDPASGDDLTYDAGLIPIADIGDYVWIDADQDGIQDASESGLNGVTVNLYASDGSLVDSDVTAGDGVYNFPSVAAGDYYIEYDIAGVPGGFVFTEAAQGNGLNDSDPDPNTGLSNVFTFTGMMDDFSNDAGVYAVAYIGDFVWLDENANGIQDGEDGMAGVGVTLYDYNTGLPIETVTTDANGEYFFLDVPSGDYYITFDPTGAAIDDYIFSPTGAGTSSTDNDAGAGGQTNFFSF